MVIRTKFILGVGLMVSVASVTFASEPSFQGLGALGTESRAYGVSASGSVVVGASDGQAFRWENGVMSGLGGGSASGVSADGAVVVGTSGAEAFRWAGGTMSGLGTLPTYTASSGTGVSADGSVVVGGAFMGGVVIGHASFRWENDVMTGFAPRWEVGFSSAYDVSADGSVVVGTHAIAFTGVGSAYRWDNGTMTSLGGGMAYGVSADGSVIVGGGIAGEVGVEAFRWEDGTISGLGVLPGFEPNSLACDVSADGSVVVGNTVIRNEGDPCLPLWIPEKAFIWTEETGMVGLGDLLVSEYGLDLNGWTLTAAKGIADDGMTIVGYGINPSGLTEGWIAQVPEPAGASVLLIGAAFPLYRRRRARGGG